MLEQQGCWPWSSCPSINTEALYKLRGLLSEQTPRSFMATLLLQQFPPVFLPEHCPQPWQSRLTRTPRALTLSGLPGSCSAPPGRPQSEDGAVPSRGKPSPRQAPPLRPGPGPRPVARSRFSLPSLAPLPWRPERLGPRQQSARWLAEGQNPIGGRRVPAAPRWRPGKQWSGELQHRGGGGGGRGVRGLFGSARGLGGAWASGSIGRRSAPLRPALERRGPSPGAGCPRLPACCRLRAGSSLRPPHGALPHPASPTGRESARGGGFATSWTCCPGQGPGRLLQCRP